MTHASNPSTGEVKVGGLEVQNQSCQERKSGASLDYEIFS